MYRHCLWPMTDDSIIPSRKWIEEELRDRSFPCGHDTLAESRTPILVDNLGEKVVYSFVSRVVVDAIREELRSLLQPEIDSHCDFRPFISNSGDVIPGFAAIIPRCRVWLRAGKKSTCRQCETCGRIVYNPSGHWYLLKAELPQGQRSLTH